VLNCMTIPLPDASDDTPRLIRAALKRLAPKD
jgi:hypothetical protein